MTARLSHRPGRRLVLAGFGLALVTGGCSGLISKPAPQLYVLRPKLVLPPSLEPVSWQLAVALPDAPAGLDTPRIALTRSPTTMDYFAAASWTDRLPLLVQTLVIDGFENDGLVVGVDRDTAGAHADYLLELEIRDFQAQYATGSDAAPKVVVRIESRLLKLPERKIIGHVEALGEVEAARTDLDAIVEAFDQAFGTALATILTWTLATPRAG